MQNIEHFDDIYKALKKEIKKAQNATDPSVISDVERMTNKIMRELTFTLPRLNNDVVAICRKRRKELFEEN